MVAGAVAGREGEEGPPVWVRINPLGGEHWRADLESVVGPGLLGVRVPKAESVESLRALDEELAELERSVGLEAGSVKVTCTIESALGLDKARDFAAEPRVSHLAFGETDFAADIGADPAALEYATLHARSTLVVACRLAGIAPPIGPVHTRLDDLEGLERTTREIRALGFFGRSCIHPKQVPTINGVFSPTRQEVLRAKEIIADYETAKAGGEAVAVASGGQFVDPSVVRRARSILEMAGEVPVESKGGGDDSDA
jgi:citrate lyase subunit beta/citryl-CoA lyase